MTESNCEELPERSEYLALGEQSLSVSRVQLIGEGGHATVSYDPTSNRVRKQFHEDSVQDAMDMAQTEYSYLARLRERLSSQDYLTCPEPVSIESSVPAFWMTHCPGIRLDRFLRTSETGRADTIEFIGDQLAHCLRLYVHEFERPYDLSPANIVFDESSRQICVLDLASPEFFSYVPDSRSWFEISLGHFLGLLVSNSLHPRYLSSWSSHFRLIVRLIHRVAEFEPLSAGSVRSTSREAYSFRNRGRSGVGKLWYATVGYPVFIYRVRSVFRQLCDARAGLLE